MKVLSVQQPFAELIVRGVKRWELRSWSTDHRGVLAIHASNAVPSSSFVAQAQNDEELWGAFWAQGWADREALICLPRSAVISVVELVRVAPARELAAVPPLVDEPGDADFLWEFANAVWIDPVGPLSGKQRLWSLTDETARRVEELKRKTEDGRRTDGYESREGQGVTLRDERYNIGRLDEPPYAWPDRPAYRQPEHVQFVNKELEDRVERSIRQYYERHQSRRSGAVIEIKIDARLPELAKLFEGMEWTSRQHFEMVILNHLYRSSQGDVSIWAGAGRESAGEQAADPYEDFSARADMAALQSYVDLEKGLAREPLTVDDLPVRRRKRRTKEDVKPEG